VTVTDLGTITNRRGEMVVILSETEGGLIVGWDVCFTCKRRVNKCPCADGPVQPPHVQRWRYAETTVDLRNQMGDRPGSPGTLTPANALAQMTVDRHDQQQARAAAAPAREHGLPAAASTVPDAKAMAQRIASGLAEALLP
jgi:hypothetical protein